MLYRPLYIKPEINYDFYFTDLEITPNSVINDPLITLSGNMQITNDYSRFVFPNVSAFLSENSIPNDFDDIYRINNLRAMNIDTISGRFSSKFNIWSKLAPGNYYLIFIIDSTVYKDVNLANNTTCLPFGIACKKVWYTNLSIYVVGQNTKNGTKPENMNDC